MELHVELESSLGNVNDNPNGLAVVSGESHFEVIVVVVAVILPIQYLLFKKPLPRPSHVRQKKLTSHLCPEFFFTVYIPLGDGSYEPCKSGGH